MGFKQEGNINVDNGAKLLLCFIRPRYGDVMNQHHESAPAMQSATVGRDYVIRVSWRAQC